MPSSWRTRKRLFGQFRPLVWLALISCFLVGTELRTAAQATNIEIGTTVKRRNVKRFGINLGGQNYYDSGQMLRSLIFRNPGFEAEILQSAMRCVSATAATCTEPGTPPESGARVKNRAPPARYVRN